MSAVGIRWVETRLAAKYPIMHRTDPETKDYSTQNVNSARVEKSALITFFHSVCHNILMSIDQSPWEFGLSQNLNPHLSFSLWHGFPPVISHPMLIILSPHVLIMDLRDTDWPLSSYNRRFLDGHFWSVFLQLLNFIALDFELKFHST